MTPLAERVRALPEISANMAANCRATLTHARSAFEAERQIARYLGGRFLKGANAVIDPIDAQEIERLGHILRRAFLAGMSDLFQPHIGRCRKDPLEAGRRMAELGRGKTHCSDIANMGFQRLEEVSEKPR